MSRLGIYAENDLPKAIAALDRMIKALEKYTEIATPSAGSGPSVSSSSAGGNRTEISGDNTGESSSNGDVQ